MNTEEKKAIEIIKQYLPTDTQVAPSYQELLQRGYYGFMHYYLQGSKNDASMSNTADYNTTITLAQIDKQRDDNNYCSLLLSM